jgi:hypothetical protein
MEIQNVTEQITENDLLALFLTDDVCYRWSNGLKTVQVVFEQGVGRQHIFGFVIKIHDDGIMTKRGFFKEEATKAVEFFNNNMTSVK